MHRNRLARLLAPFSAAAAVVLAAGSVAAQPDAAAREPAAASSPTLETQRAWTLRIEPAVWFVAPGGDVTLPQLGTLFPTSVGGGDRESANLSDLEIDRPEASPSGEIHLGFGDWRFCLRGFSASHDADAAATGSGSIGGLPFDADDRISSSLDFLAAEAEVGYALWRNTPRQSDSGADVFRSVLEVVGGARIYDVDWDIANATTGGDSLSASETFIEPLAGLRLSLEFYEKFSIDVQLTGGGLPLGDDSSYSVDVMAGFAWQPVQHFGVQIGYRQLLFNLRSGDDSEKFEFDGALAGLYGGIVVAF